MTPPTDPNANSASTLSQSGVDLREYVSALKRSWVLGLLLATTFLVIAALYLRVASYKYSAELVVMPAEQADGAQVPGNISSLGALVGINLSGQQGSAFAMYPEAILSYPVAQRLAANDRIMHTVFSSQWDEANHTWIEPQSSLRTLSTSVKELLGVPVMKWRKPGPQNLQQFIKEYVGVEEDQKKTTVKLIFRHVDSEFASYFLTELDKTVDQYLRDKSLARSTSNINYLQRRLQDVQVAEYREALSQALGTYEKTRMMASSDVSFASETLGGVNVSTGPTSPSPVLVLLLSLILAASFWFLIVFVRTYFAPSLPGSGDLG